MLDLHVKHKTPELFKDILENLWDLVDEGLRHDTKFTVCRLKKKKRISTVTKGDRQRA